MHVIILIYSGVLLHEFLKYAKAVVAGEDTPRLRIYSAHDLNVYAFEVITKISNRPGVPKFSSVYALELRRMVTTGEYYVLVRY
jgi:hypothetical protein